MRQRSSENFVKHRVEEHACNPSTQKAGAGGAGAHSLPALPTETLSKQTPQGKGTSVGSGAEQWRGQDSGLSP